MENHDLLERPDWALFRSLTTLCQKAGVDRSKLPGLIVKELVDNALDVAGDCQFGLLRDQNAFFVEDSGPGIEGSPDHLAKLFSVRRGMLSSKLWRRPSRGALGNGLRVVVGAVLATDGRIVLRTKGRELLIKPNDRGDSSYRLLSESAPRGGTRIEVFLGPALTITDAALDWARKARVMAIGQVYEGKSSPHWYGSDSFFDLCQAAKGVRVRELVRQLHGCSSRRVIVCGDLDAARLSESLTRNEAEAVLRRARERVKTMKASRMGILGAKTFLGEEYAKTSGRMILPSGQGSLHADLPYVIEAWATALDFGSFVNPFVNRTPVTGTLHVFQDEAELIVQGCGLNFRLKVAGLSKLGFSLILNVQIPYMPLTSDGKAPDLSLLKGSIEQVLGKVLGRLARQRRKQNANQPKLYISDVVIENLSRAIHKASGDGRFRYSQRQLYYVMRPIVKEITGETLLYSYFTRLLTKFENEKGDIPGMYRDPRGYLYHPHMRRRIPLGTQLIEHYERPSWTFNKIIYIEKKGLLETLLSIDWPEKNDCAILAAEGQATRADKDLFDLLGESREPITFFCIHDADAYGTMIYDRLQNETRARVARKVSIVNLGLDPWEALEMGLEWETAENTRVAPVADYVTDPYWRKWLQGRRVELNAMTPEQLVSWIDKKMADYKGKLIPPKEILRDVLGKKSVSLLKRAIEGHIRKEANIEAQVQRALAQSLPYLEDALYKQEEGLADHLELLSSRYPDRLWTEHLDAIAADLLLQLKRAATQREHRLQSLPSRLTDPAQWTLP